MDIVDKGNHTYSGTYPCRVPVWWGRYGEAGRHPDLPGVSGRKIVLRIPKRFSRFEKVLARLFKAPREVRRPLDEKNSMLWELANGQRTFEEICDHMNDVFQEEIAPVVDRTASGIDALKRRNLMTNLSTVFADKWDIRPGHTPKHQELGDLMDGMKIDVTPLDGDGSFTEEVQVVQPDDQSD
ncbi:MAG: hypothetical protein ACJZ40_04850 [Candidatus Poseidoniaceae archaeon]